MTGKFPYRPEIDGLRAIAVVPVVLFHAGFGWFSGGYIGVDVFFVISGYLITSIILYEHKVGKFTIAGFYERRARRILPALFFVMLVCLPFAWFWMTPHHLKAFSQSLVATSLFGSNIYFFLKSGYFDLDSDEKPLLHMWSLAVEEQYYIVFPLLVLLCWKWGPRKLAFLLAASALTSFGLSEWASRAYPVGNFYLTPTRTWELSLGSLLGVLRYSHYSRPPPSLPLREFLSVIGFIFILVPIFLYDPLTRFPSFLALPPTVGAALILAFANGETWVGRLLSSRGLVGIGLVSYSIYLWHQPLFAFARIYSLEKPSPLIFGALSILTVAVAYLTWRFVEKPVRNQHRFTRQQVVASSVAGSAFFVGLGLAGHGLEGFPVRLNAEQRAIMTFAESPDTPKIGYPSPSCFLEQTESDSAAFDRCIDSQASAEESIFLWGDSHAAHLYPGLTKHVGKTHNLTHLTAAACPPMLDHPSRPTCHDINLFVFARIEKEQPERVILAAVWGNYDWKQLERTLKKLKDAGIKRVDVIGPVPRWHPSLPVILTRFDASFSEIPRRTLLGLDPATKQIDSQMRKLVEEQGANYISPYTILCNSNGCLTRTGDQIESMTHWDVSHLTKAGSEFLVSQF